MIDTICIPGSKDNNCPDYLIPWKGCHSLPANNAESMDEDTDFEDYDTIPLDFGDD